MPNVGGPAQAKRALLVTISKLLYASPTWALISIKTAKNRKSMARVQRATALRTIGAYHTVSAEASFVLACMLPADLLSYKQARLKSRLEEAVDPTTTIAKIKSEERNISINSWQSTWDRSQDGRWTHRFFLNNARWLAKPTISLSFHVIQALSGHGCFRSYLSRMKRAEDSYCGYFMDPDDTAEHTLFLP
ncbi:uncharacterized protein LOC112686654, partial [Sipha flava]|uniref:Uncharacterized protein LOC112686654 n=1 Tax=Sipha flava TaxID=143950 RepID=A0A8B8FWV9_9HEMI